jgi:23S rRNA (guanosine2251-2'-O)-methyltransferase
MNEKAVYGRNAVEEALKQPARVNRLLLAKESRAAWVEAIVEQARAGGVRFDFVPQAKLNQLTGTREHQGVVAIVSPVGYASLADCLAACPAAATLLALDQVQNAKNVGMLIRTAAGAGVAGVLLPSRGGALLDEDVVRASAGAVFRVPVVNCGNLGQALRTLKEQGFWTYGLDVQGEQDVFRMSWPERVALVVGNETDGISPSVKKGCDAVVRIPMAAGQESLNVVVAAGIALFQVYAQKTRAGNIREK